MNTLNRANLLNRVLRVGKEYKEMTLPEKAFYSPKEELAKNMNSYSAEACAETFRRADRYQGESAKEMIQDADIKAKRSGRLKNISAGLLAAGAGLAVLAGTAGLAAPFVAVPLTVAGTSFLSMGVNKIRESSHRTAKQAFQEVDKAATIDRLEDEFKTATYSQKPGDQQRAMSIAVEIEQRKSGEWLISG